MQGDAIDRKRQHADTLTAYILTATDPLRYQLDLLSLTPAARYFVMTMASTHHQISPLCRFLESVLRANDVGSSSEGGLDAYALFVLVTAFCQDQARRSDGTGASCCGVTLQRLLKSMTRCLRRGGCLAVTCSNPPCLSPICVAAQSDLRQRASREFRPALRGLYDKALVIQDPADMRRNLAASCDVEKLQRALGNLRPWILHGKAIAPPMAPQLHNQNPSPPPSPPQSSASSSSLDAEPAPPGLAAALLAPPPLPARPLPPALPPAPAPAPAPHAAAALHAALPLDLGSNVLLDPNILQFLRASTSQWLEGPKSLQTPDAAWSREGATAASSAAAPLPAGHATRADPWATRRHASWTEAGAVV